MAPLKTRPSEHDNQVALCRWLDMMRIPYFAVPNGARLGGRMPAMTARRLKAEGMQPGAPDLVVIGKERIIAIEMKSHRGRVSRGQARFHDVLRENGWSVIVAYSADQAIANLQDAMAD